MTITIDYSKNAELTEFATKTLKDRYLLPNETPQDAFARVATTYGSNPQHAQRLYNYMSDRWFIPATPILSNAGTNRGLPISCFLNEVNDELPDIIGTWEENCWLSAKGGGIGTYWGNVRSIGESVGVVGSTSGIIPFIRVQDSISLAISQGNLRRGSAAVYLPVWHPEIEEFIEIRRPTGGDHKRKADFLHNAVVIPDAFMEAVREGKEWQLTSPKSGVVVKKVDARQLWIRILTARMDTGEPYILFSDTVNRNRPEIMKKLNLSVKTSNLCSEIMLHTGKDHLNNKRTAVCCLSSVNLAKFDEWASDSLFIHDLMEYLDNVLQDFIDRAPPEMANAVYSAMRERSVGLGAMGFHSYLQSKGVPFEGVIAESYNRKMFSHIRQRCDEANIKLADERGPCPDAVDAKMFNQRFTHMLAIAPNASSSIICGNTSAGIEPYPSNAYVHKTLSGSFEVRNTYLKEVLQKYNKDTDVVWSDIIVNSGSVQHLDFLSQLEKDTFKTAFEIDQRWVIDHAGTRQEFIDQGQSLNIFLLPTANRSDIVRLHMRAWEKGVYALYYCRSKSISRAETVSKNVEMPFGTNMPRDIKTPFENKLSNDTEGQFSSQAEECLSCEG